MSEQHKVDRGGFKLVAAVSGRDAGAPCRNAFQNGDQTSVDCARLYERLAVPFKIGSHVVPVGTYGYQQVTASYQLGQQRKLSGTVAVVRGSFFNGEQTGASYTGRIGVTARLALEPTLSINRISLPGDRFTTRLASTRVTLALSPRMYVAALPQYNSTTHSLSNNVRFRWEYRPGSELFVVYTEGRDTNATGVPSLDNRGIVVKVTRMFRP